MHPAFSALRNTLSPYLPGQLNSTNHTPTNTPSNQPTKRSTGCAPVLMTCHSCNAVHIVLVGLDDAGEWSGCSLSMSMSTAILGVETTSMLPWLAVIVAVGVLVTAIVHRLGSDAKRRKGL